MNLALTELQLQQWSNLVNDMAKLLKEIRSKPSYYDDNGDNSLVSSIKANVEQSARPEGFFCFRDDKYDISICHDRRKGYYLSLQGFSPSPAICTKYSLVFDVPMWRSHYFKSLPDCVSVYHEVIVDFLRHVYPKYLKVQLELF